MARAHYFMAAEGFGVPGLELLSETQSTGAGNQVPTKILPPLVQLNQNCSNLNKHASLLE